LEASNGCVIRRDWSQQPARRAGLGRAYLRDAGAGLEGPRCAYAPWWRALDLATDPRASRFSCQPSPRLDECSHSFSPWGGSAPAPGSRAARWAEFSPLPSPAPRSSIRGVGGRRSLPCVQRSASPRALVVLVLIISKPLWRPAGRGPRDQSLQPRSGRSRSKPTPLRVADRMDPPAFLRCAPCRPVSNRTGLWPVPHPRPCRSR